MRFVSDSSVRGLIVVSSVLLVANLGLASRFDGWSREATRRLVSAQHDNVAARGLGARLRVQVGALRQTRPPASSVEAVFAGLLAELRSRPPRRGGDWQVALLPRQGASASGAGPDAVQPISAYVERVPGFSSIKRVGVRVSGRYGTLDELSAVLSSFDEKPVALRGLRIDRDSFELRLDAYGV